MSNSEIVVTAIKCLGAGRYVVTAKVGSKEVNADVRVEPISDDIDGFNFTDESLLSEVLFRFGLDRRFNDDFGGYLQGKSNLPWIYGEVDQSRLADVVVTHIATESERG